MFPVPIICNDIPKGVSVWVRERQCSQRQRPCKLHGLHVRSLCSCRLTRRPGCSCVCPTVPVHRQSACPCEMENQPKSPVKFWLNDIPRREMPSWNWLSFRSKQVTTKRKRRGSADLICISRNADFILFGWSSICRTRIHRVDSWSSLFKYQSKRILFIFSFQNQQIHLQSFLHPQPRSDYIPITHLPLDNQNVDAVDEILLSLLNIDTTDSNGKIRIKVPQKISTKRTASHNSSRNHRRCTQRRHSSTSGTKNSYNAKPTFACPLMRPS